MATISILNLERGFEIAMHGNETYNKPQNLSVLIAEKIGIAITTGQYACGQSLPIEADLCTEFKASRTAVREAVKLVMARGLLRAKPRDGTRVRPETDWNLLDPAVLRWLSARKFSLDLLLEFNEVRLAIEPAAAAMAARRGAPAEKASIFSAVNRMFAANDGNGDSLDADIGFHLAVLNASGNRFYFQFGDLIVSTLRLSQHRTSGEKGSMGLAAEHKEIADAILAGEADLAASKMRAMVQHTVDIVRAAVRERTI